MNHLVYWVWLSLRCGVASELGSYLLTHFSSPREVYEATEKELLAIKGINEEIVCALMDHSLVLPQKIVEYCERVNVGILTLDSTNYPDRLRSIYAKPILLYYKGKLPDIDKNVLIACVGMRKCSESGARNAYRLGMDLATAGAIVVSGMAEGIDTAAQSGALAAGGHTIAVLGCGIDRVYPPSNEELMRKIEQTGTVITEYAPGTAPIGKNFPMRNRIIAGLAQGTVVVEANVRSGSLITANYAEKQGKDLFAYPGAPEASHAKGTNALIRKGAKLVVCAEDVLEEYELLYPDRIFTENIALRKHRGKMSFEAFLSDEASVLPKKETSDFKKEEPIPAKVEKEEKKRAPSKKRQEKAMPKQEKEPPVPQEQPKIESSCGNEDYREILSVIKGELSAEEIAAALADKNKEGYDIGTLLAHLTMMEIEGLICAVPGGKYRLAS